MTRAIDAQQSPLWVRSELVRIDLVKLVTYSDRAAKTVDETFYFARAETIYDYGNTSTDIEYWPVLKEIGSLGTSINHLPSPEDSGLLRKPLEIVLSNEPYGADAERLINTLRDGHTLENATIEWAQVALAERPTAGRIDLTALDGDEHMVLYRGRVVQVGPITQDSITLRCALDMPRRQYLRATDATKVDPEHMGLRVASVYGSAKKVPAINWDVGFLSPLAVAVSADAISMELSDATGFGSSGSGTIGGEQISWTGKSSNTLTGITRGDGDTAASNHAAGDFIVEAITTATFLVADHMVDAINDVWVRNPYSGAVVRLTTDFTKNVADTTTVAGSMVASLTFTQAQLLAALKELAASPEVLTDDAGTPPATLQQVICESLETDGTLGAGATRQLPAVADGLSGAGDPYFAMEEDNYFYCRFFRPSGGFSRQSIKIELDQSAVSGTATINVYKGRLGVDSTTLLDSQEMGASKQTYTIDTTDDAEWISIEVVSTVTVTAHVYEVWQLIDNAISTTHQQATHGNNNGGGEVSLGDWFDEDDNTYTSPASGGWAGVKFADETFDTQRIRCLIDGISTSDEKWYIETGDGYTSAMTSIWDIDGNQAFEPEPEPGSKTEFIFESESDKYYVRQDMWSGFACDLYELSRDYVVYGAASGLDVEIAGASIGYGLRLFVDVDGYVAPDTTHPYKAGAGNLMEKPADIMRHWIEGDVFQASAITQTGLTSGSDTNGTSFTTASVAPSGNTTVLCAVGVVNYLVEPNTPTITGGGIGTWTLVDSELYLTSGSVNYKIFLFRSSLPSPGSGTVTLDFGGQTQGLVDWSIAEFPGTDIRTDDGVVQSATNSASAASLTVTLAAFSETENATYGAFSNQGDTFSVGSGFTQIHNVSGTPGVLTEFKATNDTSVDCSLSPADYMGGIAVELEAQQAEAADSDIDTDSYDDCATNLGSDVWGFDTRTLGLRWEEILARMAFEARTTIVPEETAAGTVWKFLTALSTYAFGTPGDPVTEWDHGGFVEADQDTDFVHATRFTFHYAPDWSRGDGEEAFADIVIANQDVNDLTVPSTANFQAAVAKLGDYEAEPVGFRCIQEEATAEEIAGYYCHERIRVPVALFAIAGVPWWDGNAYALEVGDIIEVTPPWASSAVKSRVIEYVKDPRTEQIELRLVEVE